MLQQTRVETVIPYYERFLERFPDVHALATADEQDVLHAWAGLGYYARARNLKRAAAQVVRDHDGKLPSDAAALEALPGVGRYTVGAIRSIAFGEPAPIVDGNVKRVLSRLCAEPALADADFWELAEALVPRAHPDQFNQSLMELGATVCTPRSPACEACPVSKHCGAFAVGEPERFPQPKPRKAPREVVALGGVLVHRKRVLVLRRPSKGLLGGLWEIPTVESDDASELTESVAKRTGLATRVGRELEAVRHLFTHRSLTLRLVELERTAGKHSPDGEVESRLCSEADLQALPLSKLMRKALARAGLEPT